MCTHLRNVLTWTTFQTKNVGSSALTAVIQVESVQDDLHFFHQMKSSADACSHVWLVWIYTSVAFKTDLISDPLPEEEKYVRKKLIINRKVQRRFAHHVFLFVLTEVSKGNASLWTDFFFWLRFCWPACLFISHSDWI